MSKLPIRSLHAPRRSRANVPVALGILLLMLGVGASGCVNSLVMIGKTLMGDPVQKSAFEQATGTSLVDEEVSVILICTANGVITDEFGQVASGLEEELVRRMKRHHVNALPPDSAIDIIEDLGGVFDPKAIARQLDDLDYIMHLDLDKFSCEEESSPNLYRGRSSGVITGYEVRGERENRHVVQVFRQEFRTQYPPTHPVPADQTPRTVFIRRTLDHLADSLGATFYDVRTSDLFVD